MAIPFVLTDAKRHWAIDRADVLMHLRVCSSRGHLAKTARCETPENLAILQKICIRVRKGLIERSWTPTSLHRVDPLVRMMPGVEVRDRFHISLRPQTLDNILPSMSSHQLFQHDEVVVLFYDEEL